MLIGHTDEGAFEQSALTHRDLLDLVREDFETGDRDHVLLAVDDLYATLGIHDADVTGAEESRLRSSP